MKGKRLGRGLEEISQVFISSESAQTVKEIPLERNAPEPDPPAKKASLSSVHTIGMTGGPLYELGLFALCNISIELARQGYRILVVDDDPGSLNVTRMMGHSDIAGHAEAVFCNAPMGVRIAYRTSFQNEILSQGRFGRKSEKVLWPKRFQRFDFILIHLPFGRFGEMGALLRLISRAIVFTPSDSDGMLKAYTAIKDLHQCARQIDTGLTVYTDKGEEDAIHAFYRMARNVKNFLNKDLESYSFLQKAEKIDESMKEGIPMVLKWTSSETRRELYNISGLIIEDHAPKRRLREEH
jgi:MinD-like ATPase involved in chromosome partitioning or flagellar assembly